MLGWEIVAGGTLCDVPMRSRRERLAHRARAGQRRADEHLGLRRDRRDARDRVVPARARQDQVEQGEVRLQRSDVRRCVSTVRTEM
jgi:hypothetical protein